MKQRSLDLELMDNPNCYTKIEYNNCLYQLGRINKYLGSDKLMLKIFNNLSYNFDSVLDIGCGGGQWAFKLAQNFKSSQVTGIDISQDAIDYAQQNFKLNNLYFKLQNLFDLPEKSYDIVTTTLVLHHLKDEEIIEFLKKIKFIAKKGIIINDLHRHWISYVGCKIIIPIFFNNRLTNYDSAVSVKRSFKYNELESYLNKAGFVKEKYKIKWHWPFRWVIKIDL